MSNLTLCRFNNKTGVDKRPERRISRFLDVKVPYDVITYHLENEKERAAHSPCIKKYNKTLEFVEQKLNHYETSP